MQKSLNESDFVAITRFAIDRIEAFVFWTDESGSFLELNQAICVLLGYTRAELLTMNVGDMDPDFTVEMRKRMLERFNDDLPYVVQTRPRSKDGTTTTIEFTVERLLIGERVFFVTHGHEVDLAKEHRKWVLESIAAGKPLTETLATVVTLAEETRMGMVGSVLLLDGNGVLRSAASNHLSAEYCEQIDGLIPGPEVGSCGTAAFFRKNVMVSDIANSPLWASVKDLAAKEGLKSCWSVPILSSTGKALGTLAMYFRDVTHATRNDEEVMESLALLASIAIERDQEQQRVKMSELRYRLLTQTTMDSVWTTSPIGEFVTRQYSWEKYTGQPFEEHQGFGWSMMIHEDDRERLKSDWQRAVKGSVSYFSYGRVWHAASNEYRYFEVYGVPVRSGEEIVEWIGCTTDVHDARIAENKRDFDTRFAKAQALMAEGQWTAAMDELLEIILRDKQLCNLTEVIVRAEDTVDTLLEKVEVAAILGTLQATLTKFGFVSEAWARNTAEEALLGVSLTGIMDNRMMAGLENADMLPAVLRQMREYAREVNAEWAAALGINPSTAITCVKPSGTVSQLCNTASGIHARHNRNYIRTVRVDKKDPLYHFMVAKGFTVEDDVARPDSVAVVSFPMTAPAGAVTRDDVTAIQALEHWLLYQREWCEHKPSVTISVRDEEWVAVGAWVYEHFDEVSGISFLPHTDHTYQQAPYQDMTEQELADWVAAHPVPPVDWAELAQFEQTDNMVAVQTLACVGGSCELPEGV